MSTKDEILSQRRLPLVALLSGVGLLVLGSSLLFAVMGAQAGAGHFSSLVTGLINSAYFAGFVYGSFACPALIRGVGPVRAFVVMASVASAMPIMHALWLNPWSWGGLRFITGVCLVGLYMVVESWLNVATPREQHGKVFAAYMVVTGLALGAGQGLILVGDSLGFMPFSLVSILFSLALLPIALTPVQEPVLAPMPRLSFLQLVAISPVGTFAAIASGVLTGAFLSLGHVFALGVGVSRADAASFMAASIVGGAALQWTVGYFSDRFDRRRVLLLVCAVSAATAMAGFFVARENQALVLALGVVLGGLIFTVYGLSVAIMNDSSDPSRVLEVTGGLLLLYGVGAMLGPTLGGSVMDGWGATSFLLFLGAVLCSLAAGIVLDRGAPPLCARTNTERVNDLEPSRIYSAAISSGTATNRSASRP
jgi:MFS family permease